MLSDLVSLMRFTWVTLRPMYLTDDIGRDFVSTVQQHLLALGGPGMFSTGIGCGTAPLLTSRFSNWYVRISTDDALSDDAMENFQNPVMLPHPDLGNLAEVDQMMRGASTTPAGRDSLAKFVIGDDYLRKLVPLVEVAEELQALTELHRLSNIMKMLILLNDTQIIEYVASDDIVLGVVGALECGSQNPLLIALLIKLLPP